MLRLKALFKNVETFKRELISANGTERFYGTMFRPEPSSYVAYYRGKRGLIIYAIQFSDASAKAYRRILKALYQQDDWEKEVLLIKPIDQSQIRLRWVDDMARVREAISPQKSKLNFKQPIRMYSPNMKLHLSSEGNYLVPYDINNPPYV